LQSGNSERLIAQTRASYWNVACIDTEQSKSSPTSRSDKLVVICQ